jgi:MoxR-like ATPase
MLEPERLEDEDVPDLLNMDLETQKRIEMLEADIGGRIVGNAEVIEHILLCVFSGGHILIESPPGLGKTEMSKCIAQSLELGFRRIQCTPDLAPKDIIGDAYADDPLGFKVIGKGPLFTNILLVDEINRAQPKTQSALLEAMAEKTVTLGGHTYRLPEPFTIVATQNPIDYEGTYRLPEAQHDRFLMKTYMSYLSPQDEKTAIKLANAKPQPNKLFSPTEVLHIQKRIIEDVEADDAVVDYIIALVGATRARKEVSVGASTRAAILLMKAVKARAFLLGRDKATTGDVKALAHPVLRHRLVMNPDARNFGYTSDDLIDDILRKMKPKVSPDGSSF